MKMFYPKCYTLRLQSISPAPIYIFLVYFARYEINKQINKLEQSEHQRYGRYTILKNKTSLHDHMLPFEYGYIITHFFM